MKISLNWLKDYIKLDENEEEIAEILTATGLEVEKTAFYTTQKDSLKDLVIGEVLECGQHPNADKLKLTVVDIGNGEPSQIVCGAPNVDKGQKVVVAPVNSTIYPLGGDPFKIKKAKIRGEVSHGMICAEDEMGIGEDHDGILVLDTDLPNGSPAVDYFDAYNDYVFEIGLTPNRGDATSHFGVSRDLKGVLGRETKLPSVDHFTLDRKGNHPEVIVENTEACPRYTSVSLENVKIGESPKWLKNYLSAIGVKCINNVVDITNFVLHETGQPLHAFDADEITGDKVVVKTLSEGSKFITLDEEERTLTANDLMICNSEGGMCIAGVFGGISSGVKETTTRIFLESACFSPDWIRSSSLHHSLKTDAAFRFERGTDPNMTVYAAKRAALLMKELAGAEIVSEIDDIYPEPVANFEIEVTYKNINRLIGIEVPVDRVKEILNRLDIQLENISETGFTAIVPPYRVDVTREADVIEEILRIYGFNNIPLSESLGSTYLAGTPEVDKEVIFKELNNMLASMGYYETLTNSLTNPVYDRLPESIDETKQVVILNKLSEELEVMRQSMLFHMLEVASYNVSHKQSNLKFFEFGKTYHKKENGYKEEGWVSLLVSGAYQAGNWNEEKKLSSFFNVSNTVQKVIGKVATGELSTSPADDDLFSYGLEYLINGSVIGRAGSVSDKIKKHFELKQDVFYAEINIKKLLKNYKQGIVVEEVPKYPEVKRDLSLVLDETVSYATIEQTARKNTNYLLKGMNVFDVYRGDKIGDGKKAYAINFILQDTRKTLSEKEIDKTMARLMKVFKEDLGAIIRE